ncbi:2-oxo acid dehydrogenase subunit E2, partial [Staphylococcus warneri]|uniref:2-oxo acid dehydrogenase subunit E2 n=1 Tax=Staphylococcus warneri TaxID=1292 RepID=UPI0016424D25
FGSLSSIPIINHPQPPILQLQSLLKKPLLIHHIIPITTILNLSMSIHHPILHALQTPQFINHIKQPVQQYTVQNTNIYYSLFCS